MTVSTARCQGHPAAPDTLYSSRPVSCHRASVLIGLGASATRTPPDPAGRPADGIAEHVPRIPFGGTARRDGLSYHLIGRNVGLSKNTVMMIVTRGAAA
jgi:hypothetical protein